MGVDLYLEDEQGTKLDEVLDPNGFISLMLLLPGYETTVLLRFIDPYGDTVFNQLQIPVLIREFEAVRDLLTDDIIDKRAQQNLDDARKANWAPTVIQYIELSYRGLSASDIRAHLERVLDLAHRAQEVHAYLKFVGD
jgi:hypothetical protein